MPQVLGLDIVPALSIASPTTILMPATYQGKATRVTVGGQQFQASAAITMNLASVGPNGLDAGSLAANTLYYIYAVKASGVLALVASTSALAPAGYLSWKEIGRFRTLYAATTIAQIANRVGPGTSVVPAPSADIAWTPTVVGFATLTNINPRARRVGANLHLAGRFNVATPDANPFSIIFPPNLTVLAVSNALMIVGKWCSDIVAVNTTKAGTVSATLGDNFIRFTNDDYGKAGAPNAVLLANALGTTTFWLDGEVIVPVAEFVGLFD